VGERHATPAAAVGDTAILRELVAAPQRDHHAPGLEEHHVGIVTGRLPSERLVERLGPAEIHHAERDQTESLFQGFPSKIADAPEPIGAVQTLAAESDPGAGSST
jgi:hypothetical protein